MATPAVPGTNINIDEYGLSIRTLVELRVQSNLLALLVEKLCPGQQINLHTLRQDEFRNISSLATLNAQAGDQ